MIGFLFTLAFVTAIVLGAYLGVVVEQQFGMSSFWVALGSFAILFPVLSRMVIALLSNEFVIRAMEQFVNRLDP